MGTRKCLKRLGRVRNLWPGLTWGSSTYLKEKWRARESQVEPWSKYGINGQSHQLRNRNPSQWVSKSKLMDSWPSPNMTNMEKNMILFTCPYMAAEIRPSIRFLPRTRSSSRLEIRLDLIFSTLFASLFCLSIRRHWISRLSRIDPETIRNTALIVCTCCMPWHVLTFPRPAVKALRERLCNWSMQCLSHLFTLAVTMFVAFSGQKVTLRKNTKVWAESESKNRTKPRFLNFYHGSELYSQFSLTANQEPTSHLYSCSLIGTPLIIDTRLVEERGRVYRASVMATEDRAAKHVRYHRSWYVLIFRTCDWTDTNKSIYNKNNRRINYRINMCVYVYIYIWDWNHFNPVTWDDFGFLYVCKWLQVTFL